MAVSKAMAEKIMRSYRDAYDSYRNAVLTGERKAGTAEIDKIKRQDHDLKYGVPGFKFDIDQGVKPLLWISLNLAIPMGPKAGKPMILEPWQAYDTIVLFGWISDDGSKERRFVDAYVQIARKNGKSTYMGALLDYLAFAEYPGTRCYIGATSLDQAGETFDRASLALQLRKKPGTVDVQNSKNNRKMFFKQGQITAIAAEPKDGKLAHASIIDEYHEHKSNALIDSIHSGNVSESASLLLRVTTAGTNSHGVCHQEYEKCKKVLKGLIDLPRYFVSIYELDASDDPSDCSCWEKANPNMGVSVRLDLMKHAYQDACLSETEFTVFKTKNLNIWCSALSTWANMPVWLERCKWDYDLASLEGHVCYGALDLSAVSDFTSFTLDFPVGEKHVQLTHCWIPSERKDEIQRQCDIPLDDWIKNGYVTAVPGPVIDYDFVADYIEECYKRYKLLYIACDSWNINELATSMPDWFRELSYEFSQAMKSMSPSTRAFEKAYLQGQITALGNPVLDWMMECVEAYQDSSGNIKLVKPRRRTSKRIDGIITSIMALDGAVTHDVPLTDEEVGNMISWF